jgi:pyrroline-5-carboxylate reductase
MPNTPCLVGEAATGFALGSLATDSDRQIVQTIFGSVGLASEISEVLLNAVTGVSGSGPAYVFQFIEALSDGGVRAGLPRSVATQLAAQTVKGAAEMVLQTGEHPGELKDKVASPGGTTIAGVAALEEG